jgi:hypothetical protein
MIPWILRVRCKCHKAFVGQASLRTTNRPIERNHTHTLLHFKRTMTRLLSTCYAGLQDGLCEFTGNRRFFYKPITLSALSVGLVLLAYVATTQDVLQEGKDKRQLYVCCALTNIATDSSHFSLEAFTPVFLRFYCFL